MKTLAILLAGIAITAGAVIFVNSKPPKEINGHPQPSAETDGSEAAKNKQLRNELAERLRGTLTEADWPQTAADALIDLNMDRFWWLQTNLEEFLNREFQAYGSLKLTAKQAELLALHPELAGVLLAVRNREQFAEGILQLSDEKDRFAIINSFVKYTEVEDLSDWSSAVASHGPSIAALLRLCPAWPIDSAFIYPQDNAEVAEAYAHWINELFDRDRLPSSDDEILSLLMFVQANGPAIRARMADEPKFRSAFLSTIWPTFTECLRDAAESRQSRVPWEFFTDCDALWSLLSRPDGKALFARSGEFAAELLYGQQAVLPELREKAVQLLLLGNQELVGAAFSSSWSNNYLFVRLIRDRNLTDDQLLTCCQKLMSNKEPLEQLDQWNQMSNEALAEDIGPPPGGIKTYIPGFAIYYAGKKIAQGRSVGWIDAVGIGGDVLTLATLGTATIATQSGKKAAEKAATAALQQKLRAEAVEDVAKLAGREIAEQAAQKDILAYTANHALKMLPANLQKKLLTSTVLDLTDLTKAGFDISKRFGMDRGSFNKLTSLEARIFMRQDGKVLVSMPSLVVGSCYSAAFLNATALNGLIDETITLPPVQQTIVDTIELVKDEDALWKKNIACWWTTHAISTFNTQPK